MGDFYIGTFLLLETKGFFIEGLKIKELIIASLEAILLILSEALDLACLGTLI